METVLKHAFAMLLLLLWEIRKNPPEGEEAKLARADGYVLRAFKELYGDSGTDTEGTVIRDAQTNDQRSLGAHEKEER